MKIFSTINIPDTLHSDQGRNFKSTIINQNRDAFGVKKYQTSAYHPQVDGTVGGFNRSLLQLLRTYVSEEVDWECYRPLVRYAYRTAVHSTTVVSPFEHMFGRKPAPTVLSDISAFNPTSYQTQLWEKQAELKDLVELNLAQAAHEQKVAYDRHSAAHSFKVGYPVWLSVPTAGKLSHQWEGKWTIKTVFSRINMEITDGRKSEIVLVNQLQHRIQQ